MEGLTTTDDHPPIKSPHKKTPREEESLMAKKVHARKQCKAIRKSGGSVYRGKPRKGKKRHNIGMLSIVKPVRNTEPAK
jgi:hypothetical protein